MIGTLLRNRYRIDAKLGEGGMGVVYRAQDSLLARPVAIKTLSPALFGEEGARRFLREAQSAAKLHHPHIVSIFDAVEEGGQFAIVMELVEGQTLREVLPLPIPRLIEIALQVLEGLEYAHAQGIVHRDIKPENIIITPEGTAKLMDFGLARSEGRSRLTQTGMVVGTVAYMAPEQALQGIADARSDLYALGCVLYELVAGRPPFEGDEPIAVITQHINIPPVAPRFHAPGIPRAVEAVILKLLAKDPAARYKSARDASAALEELRGVAGGPEPPGALTGTALVQSVRQGVLVGRHEELRTLRGLLDEASGGEGHIVLVSGQAGVGKTRLVEELITYAHLRSVRVLSAKCYAGGTPYEPIVRMLREYLRTSSAEEVREALGDYAADLVPLAPEVRQKVGAIRDSIPLPPDQERARLFESVTRLFVTLSGSAPLLLFVDDLHLADSATLQLLRYLAPAVAGQRVLLVAAYQSEEADRTPAVAEVLRQLRRERHATGLEIKPLTVPEVTEMIQRMANHPRPPTRFAGRIYEVTEGNPYFIEEVINALFEQGTLYVKDGEWTTDFDEGARYTEMPVPASVRATVEARLDQLGEEIRQVMIPAAVLGRQFGVGALAEMAGKDEDELLDILDRALTARLVREVRVAGEDRYEFTQSMTREVIYEGLARHRRRRMHLRAAEALEKAYAGRTRERAAELADHLLEAGEEERAVPYCIMAGEQAEAVFAHDEAIGRYETARELLEDGGKTDEALQVLERLGEPYLYTGQPRKAVDCYRRVLAHYEAQGQRLKVAQLRRKIGHVYQISWDFATAIPILEQALGEFGEDGGREVLMLYLDLARAYVFGGRPEQAIEWARKALEMAQAFGTVDELAAAHTEMGLGYGHTVRPEEAELHYREAIRLGEQSKGYLGKSSLSRSINNLGAIEMSRNNFRGDLDGRLGALAVTEEMRGESSLPFQLINVGRAMWRLGQWHSARPYHDRLLAMGERAGLFARPAAIHLKLLDEEWEEVLEDLQAEVAASEKQGDLQGVEYNLALLAERALVLGRPEEAEQFARRAVELARHRADRDPHNLLAESLARQGRVEEAARVCDEAEANARAIHATGLWGTIYQARGLIAAAAGRRDEAVDYFLKGIRVLDEFPHPYAQARMYEDLGALYGEGDLPRALEAYRAAQAIYERLGAQKSQERMRGVIQRLEGAVR